MKAAMRPLNLSSKSHKAELRAVAADFVLS